MLRQDIQGALEELREDALLPHPVRLRDMILRSRLDPDQAVSINREFQEYLAQYGQAQKTAEHILAQIVTREPKD